MQTENLLTVRSLTHLLLLYRCNSWCDVIPKISGMKNHLFERTFGVGHGLDLLAVNTQRGRDHGAKLCFNSSIYRWWLAISYKIIQFLGLPSYKKFRQSCRLKPVGSFPEMGKQYHTKEMAEHLKEAYGDVEAIDLFMGGVTEKWVQLVTGPYRWQ